MRVFWLIYLIAVAAIVTAGLVLAQKHQGLGMPFVMIASTALIFIAVATRARRR